MVVHVELPYLQIQLLTRTRMKILHIEDNESISEPMGVFLKYHGFEYGSSIDGGQGLELIHSQKIIIFTACTLTPNKVKRLIDLGVYSIHGKPLVGKRILEKFKLYKFVYTFICNTVSLLRKIKKDNNVFFFF